MEESSAALSPSVQSSRYNLRQRTGRVKPGKYTHVTVSLPPNLQCNDPKSYRKAMASDDHVQWKTAVDKELRQIEDLEVWEDFHGRPKNPLRTVWVFRTKPLTVSSPEPVKKARICIQGFRQIPEQYFFETFAPTGKYPALLALLTLAIDKGLTLRQFDVKAAFLYAPLDEEIVIFRPDGCERQSQYLRLRKSLYGLKQAPANWYKTLTTWFQTIGFVQSIADPCLFIHEVQHTFLFFHVDNLLVAGEVQKFEDQFLLRFPNSSAHTPDTLLGMNLTLNKDYVLLNQTPLIKKGLRLVGIDESHVMKTPLTPSVQLPPATAEDANAFKNLA